MCVCVCVCVCAVFVCVCVCCGVPVSGLCEQYRVVCVLAKSVFKG